MAASSWYKMGAVYGGAAVGIFNPGAGLGVAAALWKYASKLEKEEQAAREAARQQSSTEFRDKFYARQNYASYADYLRSPIWASKRAAVLRRSQGVCEHAGCSHGADEVHHLYYPHVWGRERIDTLVALCEAHHREAHGRRSTLKAGADHEQDERPY